MKQDGGFVARAAAPRSTPSSKVIEYFPRSGFQGETSRLELAQPSRGHQVRSPRKGAWRRRRPTCRKNGHLRCASLSESFSSSPRRSSVLESARWLFADGPCAPSLDPGASNPMTVDPAPNLERLSWLGGRGGGLVAASWSRPPRTLVHDGDPRWPSRDPASFIPRLGPTPGELQLKFKNFDAPGVHLM